MNGNPTLRVPRGQELAESFLLPIWRGPFQGPFQGSEVDGRSPHQQRQMLSFPCHVYVPGMTECENVRGEDTAASLPTTKTAALHKRQGPGGPTELAAGNRTTPDSPLWTRELPWKGL